MQFRHEIYVATINPSQETLRSSFSRFIAAPQLLQKAQVRREYSHRARVPSRSLGQAVATDLPNSHS